MSYKFGTLYQQRTFYAYHQELFHSCSNAEIGKIADMRKKWNYLQEKTSCGERKERERKYCKQYCYQHLRKVAVLVLTTAHTTAL